MPTGRKASVVGAAGFLGAALAARLEARGHSVRRFTRDAPALAPDGSAAVGFEDVHTVFWLASSINPAVAEFSPDELRRDTERFAAMTSLLAASRIGRVVVASSGGTVYDTSAPPPYRETSPTSSAARYGAAKIDMENVLRDEARLEGRRVILRISNAYGPGQRGGSGQGVIAHWLDAAARNAPLRVIGDLETRRDFVYVDDVVDAFVAVHELTTDVPEVINIGSGVATSLAEVLHTLRGAVGLPGLALEYLPARGFDLRRTWLDVSIAAEFLDWKPETNLDVGIARTWAWRCAQVGL